MKRFYIIMSTICAFEAMDFIYSGEFLRSDMLEAKVTTSTPSYQK